MNFRIEDLNLGEFGMGKTLAEAAEALQEKLVARMDTKRELMEGHQRAIDVMIDSYKELGKVSGT